MEKKYQVVSASTLMHMNVRFKEINSNDFISLSVGIDYANEKVVFFEEKLAHIDYTDLEQEILMFLRPPLIEQPTFSRDMINRINQAINQDTIHKNWSSGNE